MIQMTTALCEDGVENSKKGIYYGDSARLELAQKDPEDKAEGSLGNANSAPHLIHFTRGTILSMKIRFST